VTASRLTNTFLFALVVAGALVGDALAAPSSKQTPTMFVLDVEVGAGVPETDRSVLAEVLLAAMQDGAAWRLVPQRDVALFLDQERRAQALGKKWDCVTDKCMADLAGYYGGSVVRTFIGRVGDALHISVRVTNSKSGVVAAGSAFGPDRKIVEILRQAGFACLNDWRQSRGLEPRAVPAFLAAPPDEFLVALDSSPRGAEVLVDGKPQCPATPCQARLAAGPHEATFQLDRHLTLHRKFTAAEGVQVTVDMLPRFGTVSVETEPVGLVVHVAGRDVGKSPIRSAELDGVGEISVADRCFLPSAQALALRPGEHRDVKLVAARRTAALVVQAHDWKGVALPAAATMVTVDGVAVGPAWTALTVPLCGRELRVKLGDESFASSLRLEEGTTTTIRAQPNSIVLLEGGYFRSASATRRVPGTAPALVGRAEYVAVSSFALDATEVTVGEYRECVRAGRCAPAFETISVPGMSAAEVERWSQLCNREREDRLSHPVNCVDWNQASAYCRWKGKRLPTDDEWEWAARGGKAGSAYPWGNAPPAGQLCWSDGDSRGRSGTCSVGAFPQGDSPSGIKDLSGNVWEWTATSRWSPVSRTIRGGGWADTSAPSVAAASSLEPELRRRAADVGFRCARDP
jgi:formylglycine-generating enzyme required for sulfatase activity